MEYKCECYDDFFTKWFEITDDFVFNSLRRAELMGFLSTLDVCKNGKIYIHIKEDDWCQTSCPCIKEGMETYECEFFDNDMPTIRHINVVAEEISSSVEQINSLLMGLPEMTYVNIIGVNGPNYDAALCHLEVDDNDPTQVLAIVQELGNK